MKPKLMAKQLQYKKNALCLDSNYGSSVGSDKARHSWANEKKRNHRSGRNDQKEKKWKFTETQHP